MLLFTLTKRINKAVAPSLLSWSLRVHESLSSSSLLPSFVSPSLISLLPLAQRLVSIEVQDDYQHARPGKRGGDGSSGGDGASRSAWDAFVDQTWNVLFEDRDKRRADAIRDARAEAEALRQYQARQQRRRDRRRTQNASRRGGRPPPSAPAIRDSAADERERDEGAARVQLLERYLGPALLLPGAAAPLGREDRPVFAHHRAAAAVNHGHYDGFVKWARGEYLVAR